MKNLILLLAMIVSANAAAEDEVNAVIYVRCQCSFTNSQFLSVEVSTYGTDSTPTQEDLDSCIIDENAQVINTETESSCWTAKMNARYNCTQIAKRQLGKDFVPVSQVQLKEDTCVGSILEKE